MAVSNQTHRQLAIAANNSTWEFLSQPAHELSPEDAIEMTFRAYAAAYHWARAQDRTIANEARAHWLVSRVWSVRGFGVLALDHARKCLEACESGQLLDFDLAYAHEALARAHACLGHNLLALQHRNTALEIGVADPQDRLIVCADIAAEPWFGLAPD